MKQQDQYNFIMDGSPSGRPKPSLFGGGSKTKPLMIIVGGGILLIIIVLILSSVFNGGPKNKDQLLKVAQQQQELIRVAQLGVKGATTTQPKNLAITTSLSLQTDQKPLLAALAKQDVKVTKKELEAGKNTKTDTMLETAKQNNRYDEAFMAFLQKELVTYQKNLNAAYKATTTKALKNTLRQQYQNASVLIGVEAEE